MDEKLELQLVEKYPKILKDYGGDEMVTCLSFGFEHQNGWYDLLDECMEKMQYFCDLCNKDGREIQVVAAQIKSKFGSLRFYVDIEGGVTDLESSIIYGFIDEAERKSARTCEVCGKNGKIITNGWHTCLCEEHSKQ